MKCKTHPDAPHGFDRNGSHSEDRYVCMCEHWEPPEPRALVLADEIDEDYCYCLPAYKDRGLVDPQCESCNTEDWRHTAAAELRRLHDENEALKAAQYECGFGAGCCYQAAKSEADEALLRQALEALETVLSDAYHRRFPECCGRPGSECCGNPNEAWAPEDNKIMDALSPVQRQLSDALRAALAEPVLAPAPGYCKHCKQYTIEEPLPAEPQQRSGSEHTEPVLGTKTWFEDGKLVTQNLTAADIYKAEQQEPVYSIEHLDKAYELGFSEGVKAAPRPAKQEPVTAWEDKYGMKEWEVLALRAGWAPAPQPAKREPLTDEDIDRALQEANVPELPHGYESVELEIARAIERAHGIGGQP